MRAYCQMLVCLLASVGAATGDQFADTQPAGTRPADTQPASAQPAVACSSARECFLRGDYDEAIRIYDARGRGGGEDAVRAACGRTEVDIETGEYAEGIARLRALEAAGKGSADWQACLAALLSEVGQYDDAIEHNRRALAIDAGHFRARWQLGQLYEMVGREREAIEAYGPVERLMTEGNLPDRPEDLVYLGKSFCRVSVLKRHPNMVSRMKHVLTEVYQEAFDVIDPLFWPGRLAAAELLLEKHNLMEAQSDFTAICGQNPRVPDAHVGLGRIVLEEWNFEQAEHEAQIALETNPHHIPALLLLADVHMMERRHKDAKAVARRALEVNPNCIEALGVLAAAQWRMGDTAASQATQDRVLKINPRPAVMHHILGVWLCSDRRFPEARQHLSKAIEYAPTWPAPRTELGRLHMETGEEALARKTLDEAFTLDSFDAATHSVLGLLDSLEKFARLETKHFVIKYDEKADGVIAPYFAESLEEIYPRVCRDLGTDLDKRTIIEVFPDHMGFSLRTGGRPFIATIGACTGPVIAMSAPRATGSMFGRFNWVDVLRHEFTHTVSMAATDNRISHWFTEGLAVREEKPGQSWSVKHLLSDAVRRDRLFTLETIDWGFVRPREPDGRSLAYAQSEWMVEFIAEWNGEGAIIDMLKSMREGKTQGQTFKQVLNREPSEFEKEFKAWAAKHVEQWGLPDASPEDADEIKAKLEDAPDDAMLLARLAKAKMMDGEPGEAERLARKALDEDEENKLALEILCHAMIGKMLGERDEVARQELIDKTEPYARRLSRLDPDNPSAIKYLGYVEQSHKNWAEAIQWLTRYQKKFPDDPDSYRRLAAIYAEQNENGQVLKQLEMLFPLVESEPAVARRIADLYSERRQPDKAANWLRRAIESDPYDAEIHQALGNACLTIGRPAEAEREFQSVSRLRPNDAAGYAGLSQVYEAMGDTDKAAEFKKKAEVLGGEATSKPASPQAGR
jgi:cellulose synthase operon protein C